MTTRSWLDSEPRLLDCLRQMAHVFARGVRRPGLVLLVSVVLIGGATGFALLGKPSYSPRFVLRVVETGRDPKDHPRPRRQLAEYVKTGVFTSAPLLDLVRRYSLYPGLLRRSPRAALDAFREDIEIEVYKNYFVEERANNSSPRSARLSVSFKNSDQNVATAVTRDLGALIVRHERSMRREQAARAAEAAKREVDARRELLESRRHEVSTKEAELARSGNQNPRLEVELADLAASTSALALRQDHAENREAVLALESAFEAEGFGLSFDVVNDGSLPTRSERADTNAMLAGASLVFGFPLVILAVGAFDPRRARA